MILRHAAWRQQHTERAARRARRVRAAARQLVRRVRRLTRQRQAELRHLERIIVAVVVMRVRRLHAIWKKDVLGVDVVARWLALLDFRIVRRRLQRRERAREFQIARARRELAATELSLDNHAQLFDIDAVDVGARRRGARRRSGVSGDDRRDVDTHYHALGMLGMLAIIVIVAVVVGANRAESAVTSGGGIALATPLRLSLVAMAKIGSRVLQTRATGARDWIGNRAVGAQLGEPIARNGTRVDGAGKAVLSTQKRAYNIAYGTRFKRRATESSSVQPSETFQSR
jgi:hypothetical protein